MTLAELKSELAKSPARNIRFQLPDGSHVPAHAHVTEVALIEKKFVDCGGTFRSQSFCRLQIWVSDDFHHRLTGGTLLKILAKASFMQTDDITVDVEHQMEHITQFPLDSVATAGNELIMYLSVRHTECLAPEKCKPATSILSPSLLKLQFTK